MGEALRTLVICYLVGLALLVEVVRLVFPPDPNPLLINVSSPLECPALHLAPLLTPPGHNYDYHVGMPQREGGIV